jgi:hypothetical protein
MDVFKSRVHVRHHYNVLVGKMQSGQNVRFKSTLGKKVKHAGTKQLFYFASLANHTKAPALSC